MCAMKISFENMQTCCVYVFCVFWYFKRIFWMLHKHLILYHTHIRMQHIFVRTFICEFMTCLLLASTQKHFEFFISTKILSFHSIVRFYSRGIRLIREYEVGGRKTIFTEEIVWNLWTFMLSSFITLHVSLCKFSFCSLSMWSICGGKILNSTFWFQGQFFDY